MPEIRLNPKMAIPWRGSAKFLRPGTIRGERYRLDLAQVSGGHAGDDPRHHETRFPHAEDPARAVRPGDWQKATGFQYVFWGMGRDEWGSHHQLRWRQPIEKMFKLVPYLHLTSLSMQRM